MVVWIIGYLVIVDLFMVSPGTWWNVIKGFLSFGALPTGGEDGQVNWLLVGAFAAYAGSGGLGNVGITHYVRDKGWGMSSLVGAIPSIIGGPTCNALTLGQSVSHHTREPSTVQGVVEICPV